MDTPHEQLQEAASIIIYHVHSKTLYKQTRSSSFLCTSYLIFVSATVANLDHHASGTTMLVSWILRPVSRLERGSHDQRKGLSLFS